MPIRIDNDFAFYFRNTHHNVSQPSQHPIPQRNLSPQRNRDGNLGFYNWQSTKMTVKERLTFLFNNTILSDVTFVVGRDNQQQRIPAHRFVLSGKLNESFLKLF